MFAYDTGEEICKGDRVTLHGASGIVLFVAEEETGDQEADWYAKNYKPGGFMVQAAGMGNVFLQHGPFEDLVFISRC